MFQANQKAVIQETNINLVNIRYMEIQYFSQFFTNFGTQCFILAGLICGTVSQTPTLDDYPCNYFFVMMYNSMAASCLALATMAMLASVFIAVFGEGLAIRGPLGSVVKVIDGMVQEQHRVVFLFVAAVITFVLNLVGMSWIMMDQTNAIICTIILLFSALHTYRIALRIYNRFWWDKSKTEWKDEIDHLMELNDLNPTVDDLNTQYGAKKVEQAYRISLHRGLLNDRDSEVKKRSVLFNMLKAMYKPKKKPASTAQDSTSAPIESLDDRYDQSSLSSDAPYLGFADQSLSLDTSSPSSPSSPSPFSSAILSAGSRSKGMAVRAGGYLAVRMKSSLVGHPWERRFFILQGASLFFFQDKHAFTSNPSKPLNRRPIHLDGYLLRVGSEEVPPFCLSLQPREEGDVRKTWRFRADTLAEFRAWKEIFAQAMQ
jgi:hypothetical protein